TLSVYTIILIGNNLRHNFTYFFSNQTNITSTRILPIECDPTQLYNLVQRILDLSNVHLPSLRRSLPVRSSTSRSSVSNYRIHITYFSYARLNESRLHISSTNKDCLELCI